MPDNINERIKALRIENKLLQSAIAEKLECSTATVSYYENGRPLPPDVIIAYCRAFHVSADWLLGLTTDRNPGGSDLTKKLDALAQAAQQAGHEPLTADQLSGLLDELLTYYRHYTPAGAAPLNVLRAFLTALQQAIHATGEVYTPAVIVATNAVAAAGLQATDILYQYLEFMQKMNDHTNGLAEIRQPLDKIRNNTLRALAEKDQDT